MEFNLQNNNLKKDVKEEIPNHQTSSESKEIKNKEKKSLAENYILESSTIKFDDVAGLEEQKNFLKENIIIPSKFPELLKGIRNLDPVFIYGPPGVGKTFLANAIGNEAKIICFKITACDLLSRYGDGEKIVKDVFSYAKEKAPSIIILDEIDYFFSNRNDSESENPRRVKTEILIQMSSLNADCRVFVIGVGNVPWDMNETISKRFGRKIYTPLPDFNRRKELIEKYLLSISISLSSEELEILAVESEGYSCSDVYIFIRDAMMEPIRELQKATHFKAVESLPNGKSIYSICDPVDPDAKAMSVLDLEPDQLKVRSVVYNDVKHFLKKTRPSVTQQDVERYENYPL